MTENEREGLEVVRRALVRLRWTGNDEAHAAAMTGLTRALMNYDPSFGVPFTNFAWRCVKNAVSTWMKTSQRREQWIGPGFEQDAADFASCPAHEPAEIDPALAAAIAGLTLTRQRYIEAVWIRGETHEECARVMGVTPQAVSAGLARARLQLQKLLGPRDDGLSPDEVPDPEDSYQP